MSTLRAVFVFFLVTMVLPVQQALAASAVARTAAPVGTVQRGAGAALNRASGGGMPATVADYLATQGWGAATLGSLRVKSQAAAGDFMVVQFGQEVDGLTVYGARVKAIFDEDGNLVTLTENLAPVSDFVAPAGIGPQDALDAALADVRPDLATGLSEMGRSGKTVTFGGDPFFFSDPKVTSIAVAGSGGALGEGFLVEIWGDEDNQLDHVVVDGAGRVVYVQNRTANDSHDSYFVYQENPEAPDRVTPEGQITVYGPAVEDPTLVPPPPSPDGWLETSTPQYTTHIQGNNVDAYLDVDYDNLPDGGGVAVTDSGDGTYDFDAPHDPGDDPMTSDNQAVAVQQLFQLNNQIHDVLYGHGFDEAAGNFQVYNFGRGGAGGDSVYAEAQEGRTDNNANFATPPDGSSPRMQMGLWYHGTGDSLVEITDGATYSAFVAEFGGSLPVYNGAVVRAFDDSASGSTTDACDGITNDLVGKIALIDRGNCDFGVKVKNVQNAGATAAIVVNNQGDEFVIMIGTDDSITIPSVFVRQTDGAAMASAPPADVSLVLSTRDSALDGDIVWHEAGHGVTWRMIDNMNALQAPAIGEGMGDALGFIMYNDPIVGEFSTTNSDGVRSEPYDTWDTTGRDYDDWVGEVHDDGEIYGAIIWKMWELYRDVGSIGDGSVGDARDQIMDDLVAGMTATAALYEYWPTFVDMRDGILLTISGANDPETPGANLNRWCHAWTAFAKYGVGTDQVTTQKRRGPRVTLTWTSGFAIPPECTEGPVDATPPATPIGLAATPGDGIAMLDWDDNDEGDLASYNVYRGTNSGSHTFLVTIGASAYNDNGVTSGTTYFYVVTAEDTSGNESAVSDEASATPAGGGGTAGTMQVSSILLSTVNAGQGNKQGKAEITVLDNLGNPISGEIVTGHFTDDFVGDEVDGTVPTDGSGVATFSTTGTIKGKLNFGFCVNAVTGGLMLNTELPYCVTY